MPRFSVIMPVFNSQAYLAEAIQSVLDQTERDWELLLINDGSTDRSGEILAEYARKDPRLVVHEQPNRGPACARNAIAVVARSPWLTYLDSDDIWFPTTLASYSEYLAVHPQAQLIYGYHHRLQDDRVVSLSGEYQTKPTGTRELFHRMFLNPMCVCHSRELWLNVGGFDTSLRCCEDYDLFLRMSLACRFNPIGKALGLRRRHGGNLSTKSGRTQESEADVLRRFVELHGAQAQLDPTRVRTRLSRLYYRAAYQYLKERQYEKGRAMSRQSRLCQPTWRGVLVDWLGRLFEATSRAA